MNTSRKSMQGRVLALLLIATVATLVTIGAGQNAQKPVITISELAGPWQVAVSGNTGCDVSALLYNGTLKANGTSSGNLTMSSAGCGLSTTAETFNILSLNPNGSGTAGLTCGTNCGWIFNIQVSTNKQVINLVDVSDGGANVLAGTAVKQ